MIVGILFIGERVRRDGKKTVMIGDSCQTGESRLRMG